MISLRVSFSFFFFFFGGGVGERRRRGISSLRMHFDIFILFLFFIFLFFFEVANNSCSTSQPHQPLGNSPSILMCTTPIVFEIMAKNKIMTINVNHESEGGWRKDMIKGGFFLLFYVLFLIGPF